MIKARLAAVAGAAILGFAGAGHAAVVPMRLSMPPAHAAGEAAAPEAPEGHGPVAGGSYRPLVMNAAWEDPARFTTFFSDGAGAPYGLVPEEVEGPEKKTAALARQQARRSRGDTAADHQLPFYTYLIGAGQYVLDVGTLSDKYSVPTKVSAVPLPGAMWLFGSALVAFLWISSRRKL